MFHGARPRFTVLEAIVVLVFIIETEDAPELATTTFEPSGEMANPTGFRPTVIVATTVLLEVEIFDTVLEL
jgi:hypothetical protein